MSLNSQLRFNDDGTPRRRYELDHASETRPVLGAVIGLVLVNAVMLVKNILFPSHAAQASNALQALPEPPAQAGIGAGDQSGIGIEIGIEYGGDSQTDTVPGGGDIANDQQFRSAPRLLSINIAPIAAGEDPIHRAAVATSHLAGNDNKVLYGAAPGHGVSLPANDVIRLPARASGGADGHAAASDAGGEFAPGDVAPGDDVAPGGDVHPVTVPPPVRLDNSGPVVSGPVSLGNRFINQVIVIGLADLVSHATDVDGDRLSVANVTPSSGTVTANGDGTWSYMPDRGATGEVTFTYSLSDGHTSATATATLTLATTAQSDGTPAAQVTLATTGSGTAITEIRDGFATPIAEKIMLSQPAERHNVIDGTAGHDVIAGTTGNDIIHAGLGDDIITAGTGDDVVYGDAGNDTFVATLDDGNDIYDGGEGNDTLDLSALAPGPAIPHAETHTSADHSADSIVNLQTGSATGSQIGSDIIAGIENVKSGAGNDTITGDAHDNVLDGGAGTDTVDAGAGDDTIMAAADAADDNYYGGEGHDTYDASCSDADAIIDLNEGTADSTHLGHDTIAGIENVLSGGGNDIIVADYHANIFGGGGGDDTFVFHSAASIGHGKGNHDVILDFAVGDKIDISDISKEFAHALEDVYQDQSMQEFVFIKNADKFSKPGEMKVMYDEAEDATVLLGNLDFSDGAEFELEFKGHVSLSSYDFHHH